MEKKKNIILIAVFLTFIFVISILYVLLPKESFSEKEKRYLTSFPEFSFESLTDGSFTKEFDSFLSDNTPLREFFVGLNSYYNLAILNNGSNDIYNCADGYLIEKPVNSNNSLLSNTEKIAEFANEISLPTYFLLAPSKGLILNDKLPMNHLKYNDREYIDSIKKIIGDKLSFIDVTDDFLNADEQIYYKTDHHWNMNGAYIAYQKIAESMKISPNKKTDYDIEVYNDFFGTSYSNSGYWFTKPDTIELWKNKSKQNINLKITEGKQVTDFDYLYFNERLKTGDKYSVYLDGNHALETIENKTAKTNKSLLIIKDSYAHSVAPLLSDDFSKIVLVDLRYYKKPLTEIISTEKIDSVLFLYSLDNLATSTDIVLY